MRRIFKMTREEHVEFRRKASLSISAICDHIFGRKELAREEIEKHVDTLLQLEIEYNDAMNTIREIESKVCWHFKD